MVIGEWVMGNGGKGKGKALLPILNAQCPMPNDDRCFKPGNPSNALPPQRTASPMPNSSVS